MIEMKNVDYIYSPGTPFEKKAVRNVSLVIRTGELLGIIGHTGSGKSTLIQMMNALLKPTAGDVMVDGQSTLDKKTNLKELRAKVGMVFQYPEHQIFEETIWAEIAFGPKNLGLTEGEINERVEYAMEAMELDKEMLELSPFELSGGQKRRVAIAGVFAMRPKVLILDEPTAGLDPHAKNKLLGRIAQMHEQSDISVVLVSHSMEDVAKVADRIVVMHDGGVAMEGSPSQVYGRPDDLINMGLDVPQVAQLMRRLELPLCYTVEDGERAIREHMKF